ncbi:NB-ARC domain-containing protein [Dactylosporangium sp. CA-139066]|uniref:NB-ARC domain-containing protein n=1 Tax=Dactylosporangium sp. CA-139066 TaxID=3239930 RepID=UPI003D8FDD47
MGRPERPLDGSSGPITEFARDLRALRRRAGNPSYRELARTALFAPSVLSTAASGHRLPTLPVTLAFVAACGGDRPAWERRWRRVAGEVGAAAGPGGAPEAREEPPPEADPADPWPLSRVMSNLARPAQLPMGSSTFVGRGQALAGAAMLVGRPGPVRLPLMVSGPIGVGKTAFALRLADVVSSEFPDGQLYADMGGCEPGIRSTYQVMRGFLRALGVPAPLVPDDPIQRIGMYRSLLAQRRVFVLLENVGDEGQVRPLLARAAHSQVVLTSRARLLGLDDAHRVDLDAFARHESLELVGRIVGAERVEAEYAAASAVAEICGDLPLAINIVGRRIAARPEWALAHTAGLLADRDRLIDSLSVGDVNVRDRFSAAYERLSPPGRQAVHQLGLGGAGWTSAVALAAALGVAVDEADDALESLVDAGLLTRASVAGRYRVSTLVGAFAEHVRHEAAQLGSPLRDRRAQRETAGVDCSVPPVLPVNAARPLNEPRTQRAFGAMERTETA